MKHLKYLKYILKHKWFVFIECCRYGIPLRGILHDMSKLNPVEWFPYASYFYYDYGSIKQKLIEPEFNKAWLHHQHRNKHHWQAWVLREDSGTTIALEMPEEYMKEMLCDWIGAGKAITGKDNLKPWYEENKHKMVLHENTRKWIEKEVYK